MNSVSPLRKARIAKGMSIEAAARELGTYGGNLSRIERGKEKPGPNLLRKIFDFYGGEVSLHEILYHNNNDGTAPHDRTAA